MKFEKLKAAAATAFSDQTGKLSRRKLLMGAGGVAGVSALAIAAVSGGGAVSTPVGAIDPKTAQPLGDGFYLADGWVLSAEDLRLSSNP